ncbi:MAG: hypothetical protein UIC64_01025 [Agathobacter sp.]|nr:hypothetical protein [Agathobacter sp.]
MEWKKILANRKIIGVILILFVSQIILFGESVFQKDRSWFERYNESYEAYLQKEQQTHVDTYNDYIEGIIAQADTLNTLSVFSSTNSFSNDNLEKTKETYLPLLGLELSYVKGRTIIEFFSFKLGNWFALLCGFIIALEMSEICRNDVRKITFTMRYGKLRLALEKVGAMFPWAVVITLLFQGCVLIEGSIIFQENLFQILDCPAQTFSCFANFPLKVSTWQALALYTVYKAVILYVLMMLVWCVALLCNHMVSLVGICGGVLLVEFFLFTKIDATNVWKLLKFCNIWYQTAENDFFTQCNNLNIFEVAVNRNVIIGFGLFLTYALSLGIGTYIFCNRYPCSTKMGRLQKIVRGIVTKWENLKGKFLEHLSLSGMEMYKVFISQKGIVVIILLGILLGYRADFTQIRKSTQQEYYYRFIDTYLGEPGVASSKEIERISTKLEQIDEEYSQQMSDSNLSTGTKIELSIWYDSFSEEREFLNIIQEQTDSLKQRLLLAQALLNDPQLVILDEPTAGVDPQERINIRNYISQMSTNRIVLLATHIVSDIEAIAKEIIIVKAGQIVEHDTPGNLITKVGSSVWNMEIPEEDLMEMQSKYLISNIRKNETGLSLKIIDDDCPKNASLDNSVNLDDVYLYYTTYEHKEKQVNKDE